MNFIYYHIISYDYSHSNCEATCFLFLIQASSPLQVKYADGELERLGVIYFYDLF